MRPFSVLANRRTLIVLAALSCGVALGGYALPAEAAVSVPGAQLQNAQPSLAAALPTMFLAGSGNEVVTKTIAIPGAAAKVSSELAARTITPTEAQEIAVSVTYQVSVSGEGSGSGGDPTVTATIYQNSTVDIPLWTFKVTQSFTYGSNVVKSLSSLSWSGTTTHAPFWSIGNEGSSTSSPSTGVYHVDTNANAVFNYCPLSVTCVETANAQAQLNFYGNGSWEWNSSYSDSL